MNDQCTHDEAEDIECSEESCPLYVNGRWKK